MTTVSPALPGDERLRSAPIRHPLRQLVRLLVLPALLLCVHGGAQAQKQSKDTVQAWITTGDQTRLMARGADAAFQSGTRAATVIEVDPSQRFQQMVGFGAAITDASAWLIQNRLNPQQRGALMNELFGKEPGVNFSFTRLTIGASDFSRHHYSFDDMPPGQTDPALAHFSIEPNRADVLPVVKAALAINPDLRVMASPWSAPGWMKSTDSLIQGTLKPEAYAPFAAYLSRYIGAYEKEGVPIYALTLQNEPHFEPKDYPGMRVEPAQRAAFIGGHLGPVLAREHPQTRILDWDHNWDEPGSPAAVLQDPVASKYVNGVAWHCYGGDVRVQAALHDRWPDKDTYFTECSGGKWAPVWSDNLQHFARTLVIGATRGWARGVLLWNLALDENDGPHLGGCKDCRGVVTIDSRDGKVTRNEEYYALAHASRFVRQGARRIASTSGYDQLDTVAFRNADDGSVALLVVNSAKAPRSFAVRLAPGQRSFSYTLPAASVATFTWKP
ncbi:glycoside hydrolase family 30 beta sandwich domain-containing protein [Duganella sp. HH101]|uniref:glycoside hydrolase family 30 protein n=1 Tax=Duganella sp. HH101 TaxID=1781066 RepID=UPI00087449BF|nr:glycoside hydrolase family 30 beta sandwich domain-containing protein [Duganella sp. HH101]OFA05922.1 glucuronoxylanase XynC precursor [Duganella sp. HH101]